MLTAKDIDAIISKPPNTASMRDVKNIARTVAESMPEFTALKTCLQAESPQVRKAVATVLYDWAHDPTIDMSPAEQDAFLASIKAELRRRGEPVPD